MEKIPGQVGSGLRRSTTAGTKCGCGATVNHVQRFCAQQTAAGVHAQRPQRGDIIPARAGQFYFGQWWSYWSGLGGGRSRMFLEAAKLRPRRKCAKEFAHQAFVLVAKADSRASVVAHFLSFVKLARPSNLGSARVAPPRGNRESGKDRSRPEERAVADGWPIFDVSLCFQWVPSGKGVCYFVAGSRVNRSYETFGGVG